MAWVAIPSDKPTGYLVTASDWNDNYDRLAYLKGQAGTPVQIEESVELYTGEYLSADRIFAGLQMACHLSNLREVRVVWDRLVVDAAGASTAYTQQFNSGNGGRYANGGTGQIVLKVDLDDGSGSYSYVYGKTEQNNAKATAYNAANNPYMRAEWSLNSNSAYGAIFIGYRQTPGSSNPVAASENYAGLFFNGTQFSGGNANGTTGESTTFTAPTAGERHVVEIFVYAGVGVYISVDGTAVHFGNTYIPSGTMQWCINNYGGADPAANDGLLTVGELVMQEDLS